MFLASFPAGPWQTNCYLLAPERGAGLVVIDPGVQAFEQIRRFTDAEGVAVAGVLLTHGHIDHVASAADVADHFGCPAWVHPAERELLDADGPVLPGALELVRSLGVDLRAPRDLRWVADGDDVEVGGLAFHVHHAPGHRPGCVMYSTPFVPDGEAGDAPAPARLLFSGDVLFAGSIGRTDLPGGDPDAMRATLRDVVLALPDDWAVLSGHGPETTVGAERASNPYLQPSFLR
jgi:glyoxylase-like metal-dependent hydrolase (beta-lactamase superfamily II)